MNRLRAISIVLLLIIVSSATAAQARPRAVPSNDNFASPRQLPIGRSIKVKNIIAATVEPSEPLPCFGQGGSHSVWFTFTPEVRTTLYLSTSGSNLFHPIIGTNRVLLTVYTGTALGSLDRETCGAVSIYNTTLTHEFNAGVTYTIQLSAYDPVTYGPKAFYKLTTRVTGLNLGPANNDFESPISADNWAVTTAGEADVICGYQAYPALFGNCAFKFEGSSGKTSKLTQTRNVPRDYQLSKNGIIVLTAYYRGMYAASVGKTKITASIIYSDGTPSTIITINLTGLAQSDQYQLVSRFTSLKSKSVRKVKIKTTYEGKAGALMLDYFGLGYGADTLTRAAPGVLPLPPATDEF